MKNKLIITFFIVLMSLDGIHAQSNINPDLSLIGTFDTYTNFIKGSPGYGKLNFDTPSMELFVDGYLNPFARATANISYENEQLGVEEIYANIVRGLPFDMQIKAGKFLVAFGKINTIHPHAWPFLNRPLFHRVFFGDDGLNDVGVNVNFLLPTGELFTNLELGVYKGAFLDTLHNSNFVNRGVNPVFVGRLSTFFPVGDFGNLEAGLSASYGTYAKSNLIVFNVIPLQNIVPLNYFYSGFDFKYKYAPDSYTAFTIQGEALLNHRDVSRVGSIGIDRTVADKEQISNGGAFIYADYRFEKQFSLGLKYDYTAGIIGDIPAFTTLANDDKNSTQGIEGWLAYYPVEETTVIRMGIQHLAFSSGDGINRNPQTTITLQFLFSLGPHKAHPF
jgi:hypothetical protein